MTQLQESATVYIARFKWHIFPLKPGDKTPLTEHGLNDASNNPKKVHSWWTQWPDANIGVACGPSHLIVVDCDVKNGVNGIETWRELVLEHDLNDDTIIQLTPSGGQHLVFEANGHHIRNSAGRLGPGVDVRGEGGYIVVAPSILAGGKQYAWDVGNHPGSKKPAPLPPRLAELLIDAPERRGSPPIDNAIFPGQRNDVLTSLAGSMRRRGMTEEEILVALTKVNEGRCSPPLRQDEVARIAHNVAGYAPVQVSVRVFPTTDLGNAERFALSHGATLRYCHAWGQWLAWDGKRWAVDETDEVIRRAKETARDIEQEAGNASTKDIQDAVEKWARSSESRNRLSNMIELAHAEPSIGIRPEHLDRDPWLLNVENGVLDLHTGQLRAAKPEYLLTKCIRASYDPQAPHPLWDFFLNIVMDCNEQMIAFLQRAVGYALTGSTREQCLFILYGIGANGKSTFLETMSALLGDYACRTPTETLLMKRGSDIPNDVARLKGARLVTAVEADEGRRMAESLVKQMTGGERLTARFLHHEWFEFMPEFKIFLATNHKPEIIGTDHAIWRRIRLIPFTVVIPPEDQDKDFGKKLLDELPGILAWAVQGCLEWQRIGLEPPAEVVKATGGYRAEMDAIAEFLDDSCVVRKNVTVTVADLYKTYAAWCEANNEKALAKRMFNLRIEERGFRQERGRMARSWDGIGLAGAMTQDRMIEAEP